MHVLHVYRTYFPDPPGGLQEAIRQIALATGKEQVRNTVFTLTPNLDTQVVERPEARVVRCRSWAAPASCDLGGYAALQTYRRLARSADMVDYHFPWPFADLLCLAGGRSTPSVLTYHSDVVRQRVLGLAYRPLMVHTLKAMSAVVATSPAYAQTSPVLSDPAVRHKVRVIPLGIDEASYPAEGDETIFARLGLQPGEPYFLFIGVLRYYKGAHYLIEAARSTGARVVLAGSGPEGERLSALAADRAAGKVIFAGQIDDREKVALLRRCTALVLPSHLRSEAFGMVLVEAAMFGRPLVSCEIGTGTSFVNAHEETGFVVPPAQPSALAAAMNMLLGDAALAARMGAAARRRYELMFSGPALGRAYAELFREVAGT